MDIKVSVEFRTLSMGTERHIRRRLVLVLTVTYFAFTYLFCVYRSGQCLELQCLVITRITRDILELHTTGDIDFIQ